MFEEIAATIIEILINNKKALSIEEVIEVSGFNAPKVKNVLSTLEKLSLIQVEGNSVSLCKKISGLSVAQAAQIGLDVLGFNFFEVDEKEKTVALDIASKAEKIKNLDVSKRPPLLQKRGYFGSATDPAMENLVLLLEASSSSLFEYLEGLAKKDDYLATLLHMHEQAERSLHSYAENLKG